MTSREKAIEHLQETAEFFRECRSDVSFASKAEIRFWELQNAANEAAELLKEQEPVEPNVSDINDHDAHGSWWYQCGKCKMPIDYGDRFCRHCGRAVKWNETPGI